MANGDIKVTYLISLLASSYGKSNDFLTFSFVVARA